MMTRWEDEKKVENKPAKVALIPSWYAQNGKDGFGRVFDMNREGDGTSGTGMEWMDRQEMRNDSWYTPI